jgi:NAD(P)-dependent dehydrogenase (short-subunit alcohol dehydrogenase family)
MERTLLVTDCDTALGSALVRMFSAKGYAVVTTASTETPESVSAASTENVVVLPWNKRSPISAHTLMRTALNQRSALDDALILDVPRVSSLPIHELSAADIEKAFDAFLKPSIFLVREVLTYFLERKNGFLGLASFCAYAQDIHAPALEQAVREGFKGFASSFLSTYAAASGISVNAFQSYGASPEEFALFIEKSMEEKARKISGRWFTFRSRTGLFPGHA